MEPYYNDDFLGWNPTTTTTFWDRTLLQRRLSGTEPYYNDDFLGWNPTTAMFFWDGTLLQQRYLGGQPYYIEVILRDFFVFVPLNLELFWPGFATHDGVAFVEVWCCSSTACFASHANEVSEGRGYFKGFQGWEVDSQISRYQGFSRDLAVTFCFLVLQVYWLLLLLFFFGAWGLSFVDGGLTRIVPKPTVRVPQPRGAKLNGRMHWRSFRVIHPSLRLGLPKALVIVWNVLKLFQHFPDFSLPTVSKLPGDPCILGFVHRANRCRDHQDERPSSRSCLKHVSRSRAGWWCGAQVQELFGGICSCAWKTVWMCSCPRSLARKHTFFC